MISKHMLLCLAAALQFLAVNADNFVADPERAYDVVWEKHPKNGRDFWLLLYQGWHKLKGVSQEPFVRESATSAWLFFDSDIPNKVLSLSELDAFDTDGKKLSPVVEFDVRKNDMVLYRNFLTDGRRDTFCVVTGDLSDTKTRFSPMKAVMTLTSPRKIKRIRLTHGYGEAGRIFSAELKNGKGKITNENGVLDINLAVPAKSLEVELVSRTIVYKPWIVKDDRLGKYPFTLRPRNRWIEGNFWGLHRENIDQEELRRIEKNYADTLVGIQLGEWDANIMHTLNRPNSEMFSQLASFINIPADRDMMVQNFKTFWDIHKEVYGHGLFGLSGQFNFQHYGLDNGGAMCAQEMTPEHSNTQFRVSYVFLRGAARQFNVPSMMYHANFVWNYTCMVSDKSPSKFIGVDFGSPPSLSLRNYYMAYYTGGNYISCENQPYGQAQKDKNGVYQLTGNGKALKDIYEWSRSAKGKRGESYAPVLLLADRRHGFDANNRLPWQTYWKGLMPLREGDLLLEYTMQTISPSFDLHGWMRETQGKPNYNLRNSELGDIFDLYVANPLVSPEVSIAQLEKYPVVFPVNNIVFSQTLADTLKQYVYNGGTLVLTAGQIYPFENDREFIGVTRSEGILKKDGLVLDRFTPGPRTSILMKTSDGTPLLYKNRYGRGHVLVVTSPFMRKAKDPYQTPPQITALLKNIQREVLPVQVEGRCQFMFNVMPDGTWKVILINNDGVNKAPWESVEQFDEKCTHTVRLITKSGTNAVEVRRGAPVKVSEEGGKKIYTLTIPPAEIFVVDISGLPRRISQAVARKEAPPVKGFVYRPYKPAKDFDGYKKSHYPPVRKLSKAPEIVGKWTAASGYKSAVGGKDMAWKGEHLFNGKDENRVEVTIPAAFDMREGTWTIRAKPLPDQKFPINFKGRRRGCVVYGNRLFLEYDSGHWVLGGKEALKWLYYKGPKVTGGWDHLAVVWKNKIIRFFVNGKEAVSPTGPLKLLSEFGIDSYSKNMRFRLGLLTPEWGQGCPFAGELGDFTCYGRALSEEEIQDLAREK